MDESSFTVLNDVLVCSAGGTANGSRKTPVFCGPYDTGDLCICSAEFSVGRSRAMNRFLGIQELRTVKASIV